MKKKIVIDNIGSVTGPIMKPKILRGLSEQLILKNVSLEAWLAGCTPELAGPLNCIYMTYTHTNTKFIQVNQEYFQLRHMLFAQSVLTSVG